MPRQKKGNKIIPVAAGIAATAGVVAAGVALMDEQNRKKLAKGAKKALGAAQDFASNISEEIPQRYQAVTHELPKAKKSRGKGSRKSTKKSKT